MVTELRLVVADHSHQPVWPVSHAEHPAVAACSRPKGNRRRSALEIYGFDVTLKQRGKPEMTDLDSTILDGFKNLDTTCVSDALDKLGLVGGLLSIRPVVEGVSFCGPAFTVHYVPCGTEKGTVGDFLDDVAPGQVVVLDNGSRLDCTVWGELMTISAIRHGIAGTVIDGVCRDVPGIRRYQYPIFTRGCYMVTGKDRVQCDRTNIPVAVSGVCVSPGDLVMGDDSGALVVPGEKAEQIYELAKEVAEREAVIEQELHLGASLRDARAKVNYHQLQTRSRPSQSQCRTGQTEMQHKGK
jgi:4-hydroxy-4-methyl-2-oxoglutarate aldolase